MRVHVLHESTYSANGAAFVFPLYYHKRRLHERGVTLQFFTERDPALLDCDALCLSNKFFRSWWDQEEGSAIFAFLKTAKQSVKRLLWFDILDSTGTTQFKVLPYVDRYCKSQVLKDREQYKKQYYGSRIFTDFYHRMFGVSDHNPGTPHLNYIPTDEELKKVIVGWNSGLAYYGYWGIMLNKVWFRYPWYTHWYPWQWHDPSAQRPLKLSCRIASIHARSTIGATRDEVRKRLGSTVATEKISRWRYFREMMRARVVVSPFGLGEITLRDFEAILCGAALMKQNMDHLSTWPDIYIRDKTYCSFQWNFSDFEQKIAYAITHQEEMVECAHVAQSMYRRMLTTEEGHQEFCDRFIALVQS